MRTFIPKSKDLVKEFQVVDASGMILGRLCARIASILRGKDKTIVTPGVNCGDNVIVINSDKVAVTSDKLDTAIHYTHSGYWGNLKEKTMRYRMEKDSREVIRTTVKRMLGRGPLARARLRGLFVYKDGEHDQKSAKIRDPRECSMFRLGKEKLDRSREGVTAQMIPQKAPASCTETVEKKQSVKQKMLSDNNETADAKKKPLSANNESVDVKKKYAPAAQEAINAAAPKQESYAKNDFSAESDKAQKAKSAKKKEEGDNNE